MKNTKKKNGAAAKGKGRATLSAQQTIPYLSMHPDGVCKLPGGLYTKTVEYEDINYSVASTEDQTAIFSGWSSFLNYFDSSLPFQLSFINRRSHSRSRYQVNIPKADDNYNSVRDEFTGMLKNQISKSNNGIERSKYITFGIPAEGIAEARPRLERVEADVMGNFKRLGVPSEPMDGRARLALLHSQMHPGSREAFRFSWKDISQTGLGTKDFIAPDSLDFRQSRTFRIGQYWGAVSYLQIMASELSDKLLAEILELDAEMTVTMHIQTVDQLKAIKTIKGKISDIGKMKVEEQRKAVRSGYDPDILPPDLITFSKDAAELLADLQSRNERMFLLTFTVVNLAPTRQRLENDVFTVGGIAQKYNCALRRLDWQQEQGFVSSLALGYNEVEIQRGMTTSSTAIFIPFMTRELRMAGQALYYMLAAEAAYCALEDDLQHYLNTYESTHDYDEYHFDLDEIEHDPYVLLSLLCALHEGQWTIEEVQGTLQMLFDRQYILTEDVVVETRYRTETDTWTDEDGNSHTDTYQVPYDYYICTVTLENFDLSHVPVYVIGEDQLSRYAIYMATLGNRPDLFPDSPYVNKYITGKPGDYEVPAEYLDDETFAAMLAEAQKYIGYPYVWGGSSPATSFDCSGYVSWVINHSGWNVGRLGAQGLYNICTPTSSPKPGDLVFFKGTYDTPGVSHCGIYVGDGKMLHCGDPIGYANLNTSYWQSHFYAYGRLP